MEIVDAEDVLIEILLRLPPICLPRFQCVSKKWLSIISSPDFRRLRSRRLFTDVTGIFFAPPTPTHKRNPSPHFVSLQLQDENPQYTHSLANRLSRLCGGGPIISLNSCNGLLCVWFLDANDFNFFYVYNPTTNQRRRIPDPFPLRNKRYEINAMNIAFDPSKSYFYKLVCVYKYKKKNRFSVFSTESRVWRESGEQISSSSEPFYNRSGAFLNGAIHWYCNQSRFLCFDVDNSRLRPMPGIPLFGGLKQGRCLYFGEFGGHLHFIQQCGGDGSMLMNVFEMGNNYSQWVYKYLVNLNNLTTFYPTQNDSYEHPGGVAAYGVSYSYEVPGFLWYGFSIHLLVIDDKRKEGLVISFPRKLILYYPHDNSVTELASDLWPENFDDLADASLGNHSTCKYIETIAFV